MHRGEASRREVERVVPAARAPAGSPRCSRRIGCSRRAWRVIGAAAVRCSVAPLVHSRPKLAGCSGSPRTPVICSPCDLDDHAAADAAVRAGGAGFVHAWPVLLVRSSDGEPARCHVRASSVPSGIEVDRAAVHLARELLRAALVRRAGAAVRKLDGPVVQRAGDAGRRTRCPATAVRPCAGSGRAARTPGPGRCGTPRRPAAAAAPRGASRAPGCRRPGRSPVQSFIADPVPSRPLRSAADDHDAQRSNCRVSTRALSSSYQGSGSPSRRTAAAPTAPCGLRRRRATFFFT